MRRNLRARADSGPPDDTVATDRYIWFKRYLLAREERSERNNYVLRAVFKREPVKRRPQKVAQDAWADGAIVRKKNPEHGKAPEPAEQSSGQCSDHEKALEEPLNRKAQELPSFASWETLV